MPPAWGEIYFALLSDRPDSQVEETAADLEVLDYVHAAKSKQPLRSLRL